MKDLYHDHASKSVRSRPNRVAPPKELEFRVGDVVRVKSAAEIAASLTPSGTLAGLPFMEEMLPFCGGSHTVQKSAHKTCDSLVQTRIRRLDDAAHLLGLRCDGSAHGGCQTGCLLYWKTAWLERVVTSSDAPAPRQSSDESPASVGLKHKLRQARQLHERDPDCGTFSCQATEIPFATAELPPWVLSQYFRDVKSGNASLPRVLRSVMTALLNRYQSASARFLPPILRIHEAHLFPTIRGTCVNSPTARLGLTPGEDVIIRSKSEIISTLDADGRNRGLTFDPDMLLYCGKRATVTRRVERMIDERTGKLRLLQNDCIVLDGVTCQGRFHRSCSRSAYCFWREVWLRRVE